MAIEEKDINLKTFLEKFTPQFISEQGKQTLSNELFLQIATLLKIDVSLEKMRRSLIR